MPAAADAQGEPEFGHPDAAVVVTNEN